MIGNSETRYLIGYGTLLLRASLGSSIGQSVANDIALVPVTVDGYIRSFDLRPDHYEPSHKLTGRGEESAAMNVEPAQGHSFNGIAFRTTAQELEALDRREAYYERRVVSAREFHTGASWGPASIYVGREPWIQRDPGKMMPLWRDVVWGRTGAYHIGEGFGRYFDETTYLADHVTRVIDVYGRLLEDVSDVEFPA